MSVNIRLAKPEDQRRCSELLNVLAEATLEPYEIFNSDAFSKLISNERGSLVIAEENGIILGMASISFNLALRYNGEYCQLEELVVDQDARGKNVGGLLIEETLRLAKNRAAKKLDFMCLILQNTTKLFMKNMVSLKLVKR